MDHLSRISGPSGLRLDQGRLLLPSSRACQLCHLQDQSCDRGSPPPTGSFEWQIFGKLFGLIKQDNGPSAAIALVFVSRKLPEEARRDPASSLWRAKGEKTGASTAHGGGRAGRGGKVTVKFTGAWEILWYLHKSDAREPLISLLADFSTSPH